MLIDTTLREGQQHGRVSFDAETAVRLARRLDACRVQMIEVGHPAVSGQDRRTAGALCRAGLSAALLAHARASVADVREAAETGVSWVGLFAAVNDDAMVYKFQASRREVFDRIRGAIREAKSLGLQVRFTCEDASRTPLEQVVDVFRCAREAGADRLSYADTVGRMTPDTIRRIIAQLTAAFGGRIHAHCHNDFGLATANVLAAYEGGAVGLDVSVNGIGERAGIATLAEVACALVHLYACDGPWDMTALPAVSAEVNAMTADGRADSRPIVGRYAFTHKAGLHIAPTLAQPPSQRTVYEPFDPSRVGRRRRFMIGRLIGASAVAELFAQAGMPVEDDVVAAVVERLKSTDAVIDTADGLDALRAVLLELLAGLCVGPGASAGDQHGGKEAEN